MAGLLSRRAPSEKETEKERVSDDNRDRPGRSGLPPNLDFEREGHRDDRARYQPGVGYAGLWHSQRRLLASNRATADSGSGVHRGGTIRLVRGETRQPLPDLHARRLDAVTAGHAPRRLLSVGDRSGSPRRDVVLISYRFTGDDATLYALLAPHLSNGANTTTFAPQAI